jgi:hypothetical protein
VHAAVIAQILENFQHKIQAEPRAGILHPYPLNPYENSVSERCRGKPQGTHTAVQPGRRPGACDLRRRCIRRAHRL